MTDITIEVLFKISSCLNGVRLHMCPLTTGEFNERVRTHMCTCMHKHTPICRMLQHWFEPRNRKEYFLMFTGSPPPLDKSSSFFLILIFLSA